MFAELLVHLSDNEKRERTFETFGIIFFAIAVLTEITAYPYGQRNDILSEQIIGSLDQKSRDALAASGIAITQSRQAEDISGIANSSADAAGKKAEHARKVAASFEADIVSAKVKAADAESHLAEAKERAAHAESESAKAQLELAKLTGPIQSVPVINGIAAPDPTKGLRLRILLHTDVRVKLPTLPKGKSITWTLFITQDEKGNHQFSTFPHDVMFGNVLFHAPHSFCTMELITDEYGTTDTTFGAASCPTNATDSTSK